MIKPTRLSDGKSLSSHSLLSVRGARLLRRVVLQEGNKVMLPTFLSIDEYYTY